MWCCTAPNVPRAPIDSELLGEIIWDNEECLSFKLILPGLETVAAVVVVAVDVTVVVSVSNQ